MFCGAVSASSSAAAGSPFFLVKTRLQSYSPFLPLGTQHKYRNAWHGLTDIYKSEGVGGLYRGVGAAMIRTSFGSSMQLPTYFFAKRRLQRHLGMEEGPALHLSSSAASGFVVCCVMHPPGKHASPSLLGEPPGINFDLSQTPSCHGCSNQNGNLYKGMFDCIGKTIKTEGLLPSTRDFCSISRGYCLTPS